MTPTGVKADSVRAVHKYFIVTDTALGTHILTYGFAAWYNYAVWKQAYGLQELIEKEDWRVRRAPLLYLKLHRIPEFKP